MKGCAPSAGVSVYARRQVKKRLQAAADIGIL